MLLLLLLLPLLLLVTFRYEMLIKEVIRYTPAGHPNNPALLDALSKVKAVADGMNFDMGALDSRLKVSESSGDLCPPPPVLLLLFLASPHDMIGFELTLDSIYFNLA